MSRLIDEDEFYKRVLEGRKFVWQMHDLPRHEIVVQTVYEDLADFVRTIPTAYDVEAVVRELEQEYEWCADNFHGTLQDDYLGRMRAYDHAIRVVKRGGRNE